MLMTHPSFSHAARWLLACGLSASLALGACSKKDTADAAAPAAEVPEVGVMTVTLGAVGVATELPGRLEAVQSADVRARASGVVQKRLFTEGAWVKQGQALYRLDDNTYGDAVASAQAQLAQAQARLQLAQAKRKRYQPMAEQFIVSKQDYDVVLADERVAQAELRAAQAQLANAQTNQDRTTIVAPISGYIGRALVSEGDLLNANDATVVAQVRQTDKLYINFTQSASQVLQMRRALAAGALERAGSAEAAKVNILLNDGSLYPQPGRLLFTDLTVDETTGDIPLRAEVDNPERLLLPGMFVKVQIEQSRYPQAVRVPQQAVTRSRQGDSVLLVHADGSLTQQPVQVAGSAGQDWVVTSGLNNGDQVLVTGHMRLMPSVEKVQAVPYEDMEAAAAAELMGQPQEATEE